jgi:hypothetical protein
VYGLLPEAVLDVIAQIRTLALNPFAMNVQVST